MENQAKLTKIERKYYPDNLKVSSWRTIKKEFLNLLDLPINHVNDLIHLIEKSGEGIRILFDYRNRLFTKMKTHTSLWNYLKYIWFQKRIISKGLQYNHQWENKVQNSSFKTELDPARYGHLLKMIAHQNRLYRPEVAKLLAQEEALANQYNWLGSRLTGKIDGQRISIYGLERKLFFPERALREKAFISIADAYQTKRASYSGLMNQLAALRHTIALRSGFQNYRDYAHEAKGRFSYSIADVMKFHDVVEKEVVPVLKQINGVRASDLSLLKLRPWDNKIEGMIPLIPYHDEKELITKCALMLGEIKSDYGLIFKELADANLIDLFHRKKKSPGAYNIPIYEKGASFIFANFSQEKASHDDIAILHHEFGHALHYYFTKEERIMTYRNFPSEIAEFAAMAMEMFAIPHFVHYYPDPKVEQKAKFQQFKRLLSMIVSRSLGDAYQHWLYIHPGHTEKERDETYMQLMKRFDDGVSWEGLEAYQPLESLKVLHYFQVPFYYIEYAFSALGAIDLYRQYLQQPEQTLSNYEKFLKAGYDRDVHLLYNLAGSSFDFSVERVKDLMAFVRQELNLESR